MGSSRTDILLVGKTGHGKSATANSIVGYRAFKSCFRVGAVTLHTQFEVGEFEGRIIKVVDSPGVGDTRLDSHDGAKQVIDAMTVAVAANPAGYHCILVVMRYGCRCRNEEIETIRFLEHIFGENFIKNHAILLMTGGDGFYNDEFENFEEWAYSQTGYFNELLNECCRRVILFNNRTKDSTIKNEQMRKLLKIIDNLPAHGERYTSDIFMKAQEARDHLRSKFKEKIIKDETVMEFGLINQKLNCIDFKDPENAIGLLRDLRQRSKKLQEDVKQQDKGIISLSPAMKLVQRLGETISEQDKIAKEILQMKQKIEQMELQNMDRVCLEAKEVAEKRKFEGAKEEAEKRKFEEQLDRQRWNYEKLLKEEEAEMKMKLIGVQETYETVKEEVMDLASAPFVTTARWSLGMKF